MVKIGELFAGYGGLGMGVQAVLGGEIAWFSEFDAAPSKILAHHWPDVPNHGDITKIKWTPDCPYCGELTAVYGPVDQTQYYCRNHGYLPDSIRELAPEAHRIPQRVHVMSGGFPCQDVSLAGARAGLKEGTRSGLWSEFARAIAALQPEMVVIENVRGLLSATAGGSVEPDPWGMGDGATRPVINALGAVLGDLADLGYDAEWCGLRAADAGAPHGRYRVFIVAHSQGISRREWDGDDLQAGRAALGRRSDAGGSPSEDADLAARSERWEPASVEAEGGRSWAHFGRRGGAPFADTGSDEPKRRGRARVLGSETTASETDGEEWERVRNTVVDRGAEAGGTEWGAFDPAIRRWEAVTERPAPAPTNGDGREGGHRLSAAFVEWMMGLPAGHVTDAGLTRNEQLKALGNGVVWQQAALAIRVLLERRTP